MSTKGIILFTLLLVMEASLLAAKGVATSGGSVLMQAPSARAASMGEAFSAVTNDVVGLTYNPASIQTLEQSQASFQYYRGVHEDSYGQFIFGAPTRLGKLALNIGYYNAGKFDLFDGVESRTVTIKSDTLISLGYANRVGALSIGLAGKYLRSELGEKYAANAYAADLGLQWSASERFSIGLAAQNFGTQLTFSETGDDLPRLIRTGFSWVAFPHRYKTTLAVEGVHLLNERETRPALGLETLVGPIALRTGYRAGANTSEFSIGTGFSYRQSALDYSFGMIGQAESRHRVSYSFRFGGPSLPALFTTPPTDIQILSRIFRPEKKPVIRAVESTPPSVLSHSKEEPTTIKPRLKSKKRNGIPRVVTIGPNDTLESIAREYYGSTRHWEAIYDWNEGTINDFRTMNLVGKKLKMPPTEYVNRPLTYVMKKEDTLRSIAKKYYGDSGKWTDIYDKNEHILNDFSKADWIGKRLVLP